MCAQSPTPDQGHTPDQEHHGSRGFSRRILLGGALAVPAAAAFAVAAPGTAHAYNWERTIEEGMSGDDVRELQIRVAGWAADNPAQEFVSVDGVFGAETRGAIERYQSGWDLSVTGIADDQTREHLDWLEGSNSATRHFAYSEFQSKDGSGFSGGRVSADTAQANVRVLAWKLEALRRKLGDNPITVNSAFRSVSHNSAVGGSSNSQHMYGVAADVGVANRTPNQVYTEMKTCGFSGVILYSGHSHGDSRIEYEYGAQSWYWSNG